MEKKNSLTIAKEIFEDVQKFCQLNKIDDMEKFLSKCLKKGIDIEKYGFLGDSEQEVKIVEIEVIKEKRVEIPVEVIKEVEKIVEIPLEIIKERYNEENDDSITKIDFHDIGGFTLYGLMTDDSYEVSMPIWAYEMLFSWHFDLFGLIDAELATKID